jgi:hypothetical protein
MPESVSTAIAAHGGSWKALLAVAPGLQRAVRVSRASTSTALYHGDSGARIVGTGGAHHYILIKDGGDVERFLRDLHDHCWLQGLGWYQVGRAGQLLDRSLVDRMVGYGERLCFEGAPVVELPLRQDAAERIPDASEGEAIDTGLVVPKLTEYERHRVDEAKALSAAALSKTAGEIRAAHDRSLAERVSAKTGMPLVSAQRVVAARHRGVLLPHVELDFDHLGLLPVAHVLADPDRFVDETLADPLEGPDYGRCKAKVMRAEDGGLIIHSFAHGRAIYHLRHDALSAKAALAQAPSASVVDVAMAIYAASELEADELADFAAAVAKAAGVGMRAINKRMAKECQAREQSTRRAAIAAHADGRIIRPRPEPDGELTPTVTLLDELLARDPSEEPPMRDATGNLVVRVREPWNMHLLTSDGTNDAARETEVMKAPPELVLVKLTPTHVEMLLEHYVRWLVEKPRKAPYFGALPRQYLEGLMQYAESSMPTVRAINTAPLVAMSASVVEGVGLDRNTGLVHRIDPLLRACVPAKPPTEEETRDALRFLIEE